MKLHSNKKYFNDTAARLASRKSMSKKKLTSLIDSFNDKENAFQLQPVTYGNIEKDIKIYEMIPGRDMIIYLHLS